MVSDLRECGVSAPERECQGRAIFVKVLRIFRVRHSGRKIPRLFGGARSLERTSLRFGLPDNRENTGKNRNFRYQLVDFQLIQRLKTTPYTEIP